MNIQFPCRKIVLVKYVNCDELVFYPDLESPFPGLNGEPDLSAIIKMEVMKGYGEQYLKKNFGVEPTEVHTEY